MLSLVKWVISKGRASVVICVYSKTVFIIMLAQEHPSPSEFMDLEYISTLIIIAESAELMVPIFQTNISKNCAFRTWISRIIVIMIMIILTSFYKVDFPCDSSPNNRDSPMSGWFTCTCCSPKTDNFSLYFVEIFKLIINFFFLFF